MKQVLTILVCALAVCGCATSRYSSVNKVAPIEEYRYIYVLGTIELVSIDTSVGIADEFGNLWPQLRSFSEGTFSLRLT